MASSLTSANSVRASVDQTLGTMLGMAVLSVAFFAPRMLCRFLDLLAAAYSAQARMLERWPRARELLLTRGTSE